MTWVIVTSRNTVVVSTFSDWSYDTSKERKTQVSYRSLSPVCFKDHHSWPDGLLVVSIKCKVFLFGLSSCAQKHVTQLLLVLILSSFFQKSTFPLCPRRSKVTTSNNTTTFPLLALTVSGPSSSRPSIHTEASSFRSRLTCLVFWGEQNGMCLSSSSSSSVTRQTCESGGRRRVETQGRAVCGLLISIMWEKLQTERFVWPKHWRSPRFPSVLMSERPYERAHSQDPVYRNTPSFFIQTLDLLHCVS